MHRIIFVILFTVVRLANCCIAQTFVDAKQPHELLVDKIVVALQKEDAEIFGSTCMPSQKQYEQFIKLAYKDNVETLKMLNNPAARDTLIVNNKRSFKNLIEAGKKDSIIWKDIKLTWVGQSGSLQGDIFQLMIPFHFTCNEKEYRVEIQYCTQHPDDQRIIFLGEFKLIGRVGDK